MLQPVATHLVQFLGFDNTTKLVIILFTLSKIEKKIKLISPVYPRTSENIERLNLNELLTTISKFVISEFVEYLYFMKLKMNAKLILTDSRVLGWEDSGEGCRGGKGD